MRMQVPVDQWPGLEAQLASVLSDSSRSSQPVIHGMTSADAVNTDGVMSVASEVRSKGRAAVVVVHSTIEWLMSSCFTAGGCHGSRNSRCGDGRCSGPTGQR